MTPRIIAVSWYAELRESARKFQEHFSSDIEELEAKLSLG